MCLVGGQPWGQQESMTLGLPYDITAGWCAPISPIDRLVLWRPFMEQDQD